VTRTRVLVVDDSLTVRKYLLEVLGTDPAIEVVGEAEDGARAIQLCEALRPDVVSLDMMMPVKDGLAATEHIMAYCPTPILIVSASLNRGEVFRTYDALQAGAVEVLEKPGAYPSGAQWEEDYRRAVRVVSRVRVITHPRARFTRNRGRGQAAPMETLRTAASRVRCVAVGASTGGPGAVAELLKGLPADFPLPILVVIHIGAAFGGSLAEWLNTVSPIPVRTVVDGERMPAVGLPQVLMPPADRHMALRGGRLWATSDPERHHCRPSVDVLLESLAAEMADSVVAGVLTGMGRDGARGLLSIRQGGGVTIAQDPESSVVFGMPQAAIDLDAATHVLDPNQIALALRRLIEARGLGSR